MYPNIEHIFLSTMPNSDLFLTKENPEDVSIKPIFQNHFHEILSPTSSDSVSIESPTRLQDPSSNLNQSQINRTTSSPSHSPAQKEDKKEEEEEGEGIAGPLLLSKENCKLNIEEHEEEKDDDGDGFRTPTSWDHRIPEAKQCPLAPRKPKPSLKRKAPLTQTSTPLYLPKEVQLLFPIQHKPLSHWHRNTKKVRRKDPK